MKVQEDWRDLGSDLDAFAASEKHLQEAHRTTVSAVIQVPGVGFLGVVGIVEEYGYGEVGTDWPGTTLMKRQN